MRLEVQEAAKVLLVELFPQSGELEGTRKGGRLRHTHRHMTTRGIRCAVHSIDVHCELKVGTAT